MSIPSTSDPALKVDHLQTLTAILDRLNSVPIGDRPAVSIANECLSLLADGFEAVAAVLVPRSGNGRETHSVYPRANVDLPPGTIVAICESLSSHLFDNQLSSIVIQDSRDAAAILRDAPDSRGIVGACTGVPVHSADGNPFGAIFLLYPSARPPFVGETTTLTVAGKLIALAHDAELKRMTLSAAEVLMNQAVVGIAHVGLDGRCLLINQALCAIVGYDFEELTERSFQDFTQPLDARAGIGFNRRLLDVDRANGQQLLSNELDSYSFERRSVRKDGTAIWIGVTVSLTREWDGIPVYFVLVVRDVSDRVRVSEELLTVRDAERRRIARDLHDGVLHDLMDTLHALDTLRPETSPIDTAATIEQSCTTLRHAVSGLRTAIYNMRPEQQPFVQLLELLVDSARRAAPTLEIQLVISDGFAPAVPFTTSVEISRVLREALNNARRHADARTIVVAAGIDASTLWIIVTDNGRGFDRTTTPAGAGLNSMRARARELGAELTVDSAIGQGTRIRLAMPVDALG